tara:strand:- start:499 stop:738 length:240 start_codon:yes stop_codon:yes gene_type:complete
MTQNDKLLDLFKSGREVTKEDATLAGVKSLTAKINQLRADGFAIYTNKTKEGKTVYRLGAPSRKMVAAAYAAEGSAVFQ